jgi:cell division protease FtsH
MTTHSVSPSDVSPTTDAAAKPQPEGAKVSASPASDAVASASAPAAAAHSAAGANLTQSSTVITPQPDWMGFAHDILGYLRGSTWAGWTAREEPAAPDAASNTGTDTGADPDASGAEADTEAKPEDLSEAEVDDLLGAVDPAFDDPALFVERLLKPAAPWRPRPTTLLAVLRIARTFGDREGVARLLAAPGALTLLATGHGTLSDTVTKVLRIVLDRILPGGESRPQIQLATSALRTGSVDPHRPLATFADLAGDAIECGKAMVFVTAVGGTTAEAIRALRPNLLSLASLDREMLAQLLAMAYPDHAGAIPAALDDLPAGLALSRLTPDQLTLALRSPDPAGAVRTIATELTPPPDAGLGLAAFPIPVHVRQPLDRLIADLMAWQAGDLAWRDVSRGPLLVGPPGSGKTELARLVARDAGVAVVASSLGQWSSTSPRGVDVLRMMRASFTEAAEKAPAILFIDELDSFGNRARIADHNSAYTDHIVTALLDLLDGFRAHEGVVVMGATNHLEKLDAAIIRPGRFDHILRLDHPGLDLLPQAFRWQLGHELPDADLSGLVRDAFGMSGAEIAATLRAARSRARAAGRPLELADLEAEIATIRPPLSASARWRIAVHEAGHAVVHSATGGAKVDLLALQSGGGLTHSMAPEGAQDVQAFDALLAGRLAGRAAESLVFGAPCAGAGGEEMSDLAQATHLAVAMDASYGLRESRLWLGTPATVTKRLAMDPRLCARVEAQLRQAEARAARILAANRPQLEEIATALSAEGLLTAAKLEALLAKVRPEAQIDEVEDGPIEATGSETPKMELAAAAPPVPWGPMTSPDQGVGDVPEAPPSGANARPSDADSSAIGTCADVSPKGMPDAST